MSRHVPHYRLLLRSVVIPAILWGSVWGAALAQEPALVTPVAPPPGPLPFDIPLSTCLVEEVASHRMAFVDAVAREAERAAEGPAKTGLDRILAIAQELNRAGEKCDATMAGLAAEDPSFGIAGLSQLPPNENAFRDTLWGSVLWHESASSKTRETTAFLKFLVSRLGDIGSESLEVASSLRDAEWEVLDAVSNRQYEAAGSLEVHLWDTTRRLEVLAAEADTTARVLRDLVTGIEGEGLAEATPAKAAWATMREVLDATVSNAALVSPAVDDVRVGHEVVHVLMGVVVRTEHSVEDLISSPERGGSRYIAWQYLRDDIGAVGELRAKVLEAFPGALPEGAVESLWTAAGELVAADRLLAERAVERASTEVAWIGDLLEQRYLEAEGFDSADGRKDRVAARERAMESLVGNMDFQTALAGARSARATFAHAISSAGGGGEGYSKALIHCKNAWLHSLNAGAAAGRALDAAGSE